MIKRVLIACVLLLVVINVAQAKSIHLNYKATFGIFGKVGTIKNILTENNTTYKIETKVELAGFAKVIMGGQVEEYVSVGHMENGLMVSDSYSMTSTKKNQKKIKEYHIDHKQKYVTKRYRKWVKGKLIKDYTQKLDFYAKDDLLTLYFNLGNTVTQKGKTYHFKAVGLEKQKGKVDITVPAENQIAKYKKDLGKAHLYAKALIYQKNFRKKKGDILLAIDEDGFIKKSVIKDILMFGDAQLIRIK